MGLLEAFSWRAIKCIMTNAVRIKGNR